MSGGVLIIAEHHQGALSPVSLELVTAARRISDEVFAAILGDELERACEELAGCGAPVMAVEHAALAPYNGPAHAQVIHDLALKLTPEYIMAAATTSGMDWAPALAVKLQAGCVTGVEDISPGPQGPSFSRPVCCGKLVEQLEVQSASGVITVQPGAFSPAGPAAEPGQVKKMPIGEITAGWSNIAAAEAQGGISDLPQADVIVAAGRGIGSQENLELINGLAGLFARSAVAGSRPVCDQGWLGYRQQVGQTGATVSPKLYLACGVSGARQHTMGMQGSGFIAAISIDPKAAIFNLADVCLIEDLTAFIPVFLEECQKDN